MFPSWNCSNVSTCCEALVEDRFSDNFDSAKQSKKPLKKRSSTSFTKNSGVISSGKQGINGDRSNLNLALGNN